MKYRKLANTVTRKRCEEAKESKKKVVRKS